MSWTMWLLWGLLTLCVLVLVGLLVAPAFGLGAAVATWLAMAILIGIMVRGLYRAARFRR